MSTLHAAKGKRTSTTTLPAALREELGLGDGGRAGAGLKEDGRGGSARRERGGGDFRSRGGVVGRKEARRAERREKKGSRRPVQQQQRHQRQNQQRRPDEPLQRHEIRTLHLSAHRPDSSVDKGKGKGKEMFDRLGERKAAASAFEKRSQRKHVGEEESTPLQRLMSRNGAGESSRLDSSQPIKRRRVEAPISKTEQQEEDEIAWLEAHLGDKRKQQPKKATREKADELAEGEGEEEEQGLNVDVGEDGLGDLLSDLDRFYPGMYDDSAGEASEDEDGDVDASSDEESLNESDQLSSDEQEESDDAMEHGKGANSQVENGSDSTRREDPAVVASKQGESTTNRYIPPALRRREAETSTSSDSAEMQKLKRQAKGLLNRLGEGNIESIVLEIVESLYRQYSRAAVTETLTSLIIQTISASNNLVETFVILHAALVASLNRLVGLEFGAHFLQTIVESWLCHYDEGREKQRNEGEVVEEVGKEGKNVLVLLAHMYNLGVVACPLIFDVIKLTLRIEEGKERRAMTELDVEMLLKVVKASGAQLRHDDPTSLKTIVQLAQEQQRLVSSSMSSRSKFMMEALEDLKNNRSKTVSGQGLEQQSIGRMKKYIVGLGRKRSVRTHEPLRVALQDLRDVDKRGKWWLVGAAWAGYDFNDKGKEASADSASHAREESKKEAAEPQEEAKREKLVQIARQHGMNTAIRQSIFVILITSQDYLDALEKIQSLKFKKETHRREVIRVLLSCIGSEETFNPYYVVLATRLATEDVGTRFTLQYCLWDFLREMGERNVGGRSIIEREGEEDGSESDDEQHRGGTAGKMTLHRIANIARAYGWWFAKGSLSLAAMKVIDFTSLKSQAIAFLQQTVIHILLSTQTHSPALTLSLGRGATDTRRGGVKADGVVGGEADRQAVEAVFVKGTLSNQALSQGLFFFLERHLTNKECLRVVTSMGVDAHTRERLIWARGVVKQVVKAGALTKDTGRAVI